MMSTEVLGWLIVVLLAILILGVLAIIVRLIRDTWRDINE